MVGTTILHYDILQELGAGAMGIVYKAFDKKLERNVALKILKPELLAQTNAVARFATEAKAISRLDHRNIGRIYTIEEVGSRSFLVMAFYEGETLTERIHKELMDIKTIVHFALEIAYGLDHAHTQGVIHRDIKPANIFVSLDAQGHEQIKILDFGLSKLSEAHKNNSVSITEQGKGVGTPLYSSPEQLKGLLNASVQFDLWAWGCIVYEMLTQQAAFSAQTFGETIMKIISGQPKPLKELRPDTPETLRTLIYSCLEKEPELRIQDAQAIIRTLEPLMLELGTGNKSPPLLQKRIPTTLAFPKPKLPTPQNAFIGRTEQLRQIVQTLQTPSNPLVSIVGMGGMGKTRLALEIALLSQDSYRDGAAFVDLTRIEDAALVPTAILNALNVTPNNDPFEDMLIALTYREILIVLDNFEHVLKAREVLVKILETAPKVQLLVTSRERLKLRTETVIGLDGFSVVEVGVFETESAAQIFLQSARRVNTNFLLQQSDQNAFTRIATALSGSPLGLELAATWTHVLDLSEIADELETGLNLLETDAPDIPARQRGFTAVFNSSWNYLNPPEQDALTKLTVFRGGFSKDWAKRVAGTNLQILESLLTKSFITKENNRFVIHELIRQFAEQKRTQEAHHEAMIALSKCCLALCENYIRYRYGSDQLEWLQKLDAEHDNIRVVLAWTLENPSHFGVGAKIIGCLERFWHFRGFHREAFQWAESFLTKLINLENLVVLRTLISLAIEISEFDYAKEKWVLFYEIADHLKDQVSLALAYFYIGKIEANLSHFLVAKENLEKSISIFKNIKDSSHISIVLNDLGNVYVLENNFDEAKLFFERSLALKKQANDVHGTATVLLNLAITARMQGDFKLSEMYHNECYQNFLEVGDLTGIVEAKIELGVQAEHRSDYENARQIYCETLKELFYLQKRLGIAKQLLNIGRIDFFLNRFDSWFRLSEAAFDLIAKIGSQHYLDSWQQTKQNWQTESQLTPERIQQLEAEGTAMTLEEAVHYALNSA